LVFVWALVLARQPFPGCTSTVEAHEDGAEPSVLSALAEAVRNRRLMFWLGATAMCDLLDEIVIVFAALHLRDSLDAGPIARSIVLGTGIVGAVAGVLLTDRLLSRIEPLRLLVATSIACAVVYVAWLVAPVVWLSALLFFLVGVTAAPMYPIASAQAYRALPGRSGTVNAAGHCFTPLTLAAPWALGVLADFSNVQVALALLLLQPIGLLLAALSALRGQRHRRIP
jgi:fucose permease